MVSGLTAALANQADTSALLPNVGPATFTGNLTVTNKVLSDSFEATYGILAPHVIAGANSDLTLFNYGGHAT